MRNFHGNDGMEFMEQHQHQRLSMGFKQLFTTRIIYGTNKFYLFIYFVNMCDAVDVYCMAQEISARDKQIYHSGASPMFRMKFPSIFTCGWIRLVVSSTFAWLSEFIAVDICHIIITKMFLMCEWKKSASRYGIRLNLAWATSDLLDIHWSWRLHKWIKSYMFFDFCT